MKKWVTLILFLWSTIMHAAPVEQLIAQAQNDAYKLSIPLLVAAQSNDKANYEKARDQMTPAMNALTNDPMKNAFAAWLYGRMAFAAHFQQDTTSDAVTKLKALLQNPKTQPDQFKAWAYAYLASINNQDYADVKPAMTTLATQLTNDFLDKNINKLTTSDLAWVWVMVLQAAGNAVDKGLYDEAIKQLIKITGTTSLIAALAAGIPANDFFTWSIAIAYNAALQMGDLQNIDAFKQPLQQALKAGDPNSPDIMLAQVIYQNTLKPKKLKAKL